MPLLNDPEQQLAHLRSAVGDRKHWLLFADCDEGHAALVGGSLTLALVGMTEMAFGTVEYVDCNTNMSGRLTFLTMPKARVLQQHLLHLMSASRMMVPAVTAGQDIVILTRDSTRLGKVLHRLIFGNVTAGCQPEQN